MPRSIPRCIIDWPTSMAGVSARSSKRTCTPTPCSAPGPSQPTPGRSPPFQRLLALPPETVILPAHTSEPVAFDGRPISATLEEVQERTSLLRETEETFVSQILARLPPTPPNHHRIVALNEAGTLPDDPTELEAGANRCAVA